MLQVFVSNMVHPGITGSNFIHIHNAEHIDGSRECTENSSEKNEQVATHLCSVFVHTLNNCFDNNDNFYDLSRF